MNGWDREYLQNKEVYLKLFDNIMSREQETNVDFLEGNIKKVINRKYAVVVNSGTDALHFALISHNIKPNDEVLVSNFSWISTASCISMVGAIPVFCDVELNTYHMCLDSIKKMCSNKTRAIIYPHLFGNMSCIKDILLFCKEKNIIFIEDSCQALGSSLNDLKAGTIGDCSTFSFNANKVIAGIAGGGAFLTDCEKKADIVKKLRRMGKNKDFELLGRNSKMLLFNAEVINFRLQKLNEYKKQRQKIANFYNTSLKKLPIKIQSVSNDCDNVYQRYTIRLKDKKTRDFLCDRLKANIHYDKPLSENSMYKNIQYKSDDCKNAKTICDTILSLPNHPWVTIDEQNKILNIIEMSL